MKKFSKMFALMLLAGALVVGFASCSNDSSDSSNTNSSSSSSSSSGSGNSGSGSSSSGATVSATYKYESGSKWQKFILYSDASVVHAISEAAAYVTDGIWRKGTYEKNGDTFSDCTINFKWTHEREKDDPKFEWKEKPNNNSLTVSGGSGDYYGTIYTLQK